MNNLFCGDFKLWILISKLVVTIWAFIIIGNKRPTKIHLKEEMKTYSSRPDYKSKYSMCIDDFHLLSAKL